MGEQKTTASSVNRAKTYQLVLFPLNNGATNVYYVLVLSYIATFGSKVLALSMLFASVMVTGMRLFDAVTDPIIGALMDRTNGRFGKFRPFMVIGNLIMAASILVLYCLAPLIPASAMGLRYAAFVALYAVWVIGYTFQTSCTRSGQTVLTNDPKQRPLFTIFNTVGSLLGMGAMQFFAPILAKNYEGGYASAGFFRTLAPVGIVISILLTLLAVIGIWEKDQPKYFGIGGEKTEKIKVSEYIQIIKNNDPMQRLMVAGAGCKLALSIATNTTVLCMLYGCMMGNYDGLYLPMMVLGYVCSVPFFLLTVRTSQKEGQKASLMKYVSVALVCYVGVLVLCCSGAAAMPSPCPFWARTAFPSTCTPSCSSLSSASATVLTTPPPICPSPWWPTAPTTRPTAAASISPASWAPCSVWWTSWCPACPLPLWASRSALWACRACPPSMTPTPRA